VITKNNFKKLSVGLLIAVLISILFSYGFFEGLNLKLNDRLYGTKTPLGNVVIVSIDDKSLEDLGRWPWDREIFAKFIENANSAKVIAFDIGFFDNTSSDKIFQDTLDKYDNILLGVQFTKFENIDGELKASNTLKPVFDADYGFVNVITDKDGITRSLNLDISDDYVSLPEAVYLKVFNKPYNSKNPKRFLINFIGGANSFTYYSFSDIFNGDINANINGDIDLSDKIVFVGSTSDSMHDKYFVPTSGSELVPGVEIHANTFQTMVNKSELVTQSTFSIILMIFIASLIVFFFDRFSYIIAIILIFASIFIYLIFSVIIFDYNILLNLVYFPLTLLVTYAGFNIYNYVEEKKSKFLILEAFNKYVSKAVLGEILKAPDKVNLGGERRNITVFFSDIRGFTTISEKLEPEQLVSLLNEYLTAMTNIVIDHEGVVDKYIGDAIMAFWGAPLDQPNHAVLGCTVSLKMIKELSVLRKKWVDDGYPEINIGIGLNSGDAVIGNMGSSKRFDYTAMGDTVNLGSRLEGLTKMYGVQIIISEFTYELIKDKFICRALDLVTVKGKNKPVKIYELVSDISDTDSIMKEFISLFEKAFDLYLSKNFKEAKALFKKAEKVKHDKSALEFIGRCDSFIKHPPEKDWQGVYELKTK